jgi:asparagine synthetase B (glutamine-hydrolysing)
MRPSIQKMNDAIEHRGPDSDGIYIKEDIMVQILICT